MTDETFQTDVFDVTLDNSITQLTTRFQTIGRLFNDFKGILKFQDLSEEDLSASCNNLKSKYSNWICLKTWRNKCSI